MARWVALTAALMFTFMASSAQAIEWRWNYPDAVIAEGSNAVLGITPPAGNPAIDSVQYLGETVTVFDTATTIPGTVGATFQGYTALRLTQHLDGLGGNVGPGVGADGTNTWRIDHEITAAIYFTGIQDTATTFTITSATLNLYFDSGTNNPPPAGDVFTAAAFGTLDTFSDGLLVELGKGAGAGTNTDPGAGGDLSDGASDIEFLLADLLSQLACNGGNCGFFELLEGPGTNVIALTNNNNDPCGGAVTCFSSIANLITWGNSIFGNNITAVDTVRVLTQNDGSVNKDAQVVPLPAPLLLLGLGFVGAAMLRRRVSA